VNLIENSIQKKAHSLKKKTHEAIKLIRPFVPEMIGIQKYKEG